MEPDSYTAFAEMLVNRVSELEQRIRTMETQRREQEQFGLQQGGPYHYLVRVVDGTTVKIDIESIFLKCGSPSGNIVLELGDFEAFYEISRDADFFLAKLPSWKPVIDSIFGSGKNMDEVQLEDLSEEARKMLAPLGCSQPFVQLEREFARVIFQGDLDRFDSYGRAIIKSGERLKTLEDLFVFTKEFYESLLGKRMKSVHALLSKEKRTQILLEKFKKNGRDLDFILSASRATAVQFLTEHGEDLNRSEVMRIANAHGIVEKPIVSPVKYYYK
jgi:hypothetical protein